MYMCVSRMHILRVRVQGVRVQGECVYESEIDLFHNNKWHLLYVASLYLYTNGKNLHNYLKYFKLTIDYSSL